MSHPRNEILNLSTLAWQPSTPSQNYCSALIWNGLSEREREIYGIRRQRHKKKSKKTWEKMRQRKGTLSILVKILRIIESVSHASISEEKKIDWVTTLKSFIRDIGKQFCEINFEQESEFVLLNLPTRFYNLAWIIISRVFLLLATNWNKSCRNYLMEIKGPLRVVK